MKRIAFILLTLIISSALYSQSFFKSLEPGRNQMAVYVGSYDWGPCVNKIVIHTASKHTEDTLNLSDFEVERVLYQKGSGIKKSDGELTLTDVFFSDSKGNRVNKASNYITILTDVYPTAANSSPFPGYISSGVFENFYSYSVENDELNLKITKVQGFVNEGAAKFSKSTYTYKSETEEKNVTVPLDYMFYMPDSASVKNKIPLILWFHTIGESGSNPYLVLFGTKATALADEKIQSYFENGVAILAPQCPTGWLETTDENEMGIRYWAPVDIDGSGTWRVSCRAPEGRRR